MSYHSIIITTHLLSASYVSGTLFVSPHLIFTTSRQGRWWYPILQMRTREAQRSELSQDHLELKADGSATFYYPSGAFMVIYFTIHLKI